MMQKKALILRWCQSQNTEKFLADWQQELTRLDPSIIHVHDWNHGDFDPERKSWDISLSVKNDLPLLTDRDGRSLQIDFENNAIDYKRPLLLGKGELLAKAIGMRKNLRRVLDLTCGLGIDAVFMLRLGCNVVSLERNALLYFLLQKAREKADNQVQRAWNIEHVDALNYLKNEDIETFEVIYFDPMYPAKRKKALPRQEMVLFRGLVGDDVDSRNIAEAAMEWKKLKPSTRIVVKRSLGAPELVANPTHQFFGKAVRFDIY